MISLCFHFHVVMPLGRCAYFSTHAGSSSIFIIADHASASLLSFFCRARACRRRVRRRLAVLGRSLDKRTYLLPQRIYSRRISSSRRSYLMASASARRRLGAHDASAATRYFRLRLSSRFPMAILFSAFACRGSPPPPRHR